MLDNPEAEPSGGGFSAPAEPAPNASPAPRIFRQGRIVDDIFFHAGDDGATRNGPAIVSLKRFLAERDFLLARSAPLGVRLETSQSPDLLESDLSRLSLIELHIPYFKDGRAFSWARLLRTRLHFTGEIRLTGHFLPDQIAFFQRVGVDSFTLPPNLSRAGVEKAVAMISHAYQPSADRRLTIPDLRRRPAVSGELPLAP